MARMLKGPVWFAAALMLAVPGGAMAQEQAGLSAEQYAVARAEIVNLSNRLMIASDAQDAETYADSFATNGVLDWVNGVEHGREQIRDAIAQWRASIAAPPTDATNRPRTRHFILNQVVTINPDGKTGQGICYWMALTNRTPQHDVQLLYFGHVIEDYVKEDGKWLFAKRTVFNESLHNRAAYYPELGERDPRAAN